MSVVCKSCGAEVSPYVTECPYCGNRLRKRAPKLERHGDEFTARARRRRGRAIRLPKLGAAERPYVTLAAILGPAVLLLVQIAAGLAPSEVGAFVGPDTETLWRYLAAPWAYVDVGYLFVIALTLAIFVPPLERRLGMLPTAILLIACGSLGMLAGGGLESAIGDGFFFASGGNGVALGAVAAWTLIRNAEARDHPGDDYDLIGVAVFAVVLLALPLVEDAANVPAGVVGGLVGAGAGLAAGAARPAEGS